MIVPSFKEFLNKINNVLQSPAESLDNAKVEAASIYKLIAERLHAAEESVMREFLKTVKSSLEIARASKILEVRSAVREAIQEWETLKKIYKQLKKAKNKERPSQVQDKYCNKPSKIEEPLFQSREMKKILDEWATKTQMSPSSKKFKYHKRPVDEPLKSTTNQLPEEIKENKSALFNAEAEIAEEAEYARNLKHLIPTGKNSPRLSLANVIDSEEGYSSDNLSPDTETTAHKNTHTIKPQALYVKSRFGKSRRDGKRGLANEDKDIALLRTPIDFGSKRGQLPKINPRSLWANNSQEANTVEEKCKQVSTKDKDASLLEVMQQTGFVTESLSKETTELVLKRMGVMAQSTKTLLSWVAQLSDKDKFAQLSEEVRDDVLNVLKVVMDGEEIVREAKALHAKLTDN
eukprot:TRINITY_DN9796_c0_g3_i1.p1 TRINITY_DN9796_c0_g3~~TRINITY_DN9796_c0_g3_i1.p1  ORF type:complete len:405 (-),score=85.54 TRINITY_DN9796_c0_g3_i1:1756-2970(-)